MRVAAQMQPGMRASVGGKTGINQRNAACASNAEWSTANENAVSVLVVVQVQDMPTWAK